MSARHFHPHSAQEHAENAADLADSAVRTMNDADVDQFRDRAFEDLGLAVADLARAVAILAKPQKL